MHVTSTKKLSSMRALQWYWSMHLQPVPDVILTTEKNKTVQLQNIGLMPRMPSSSHKKIQQLLANMQRTHLFVLK